MCVLSPSPDWHAAISSCVCSNLAQSVVVSLCSHFSVFSSLLHVVRYDHSCDFSIRAAESTHDYAIGIHAQLQPSNVAIM